MVYVPQTVTINSSNCEECDSMVSLQNSTFTEQLPCRQDFFRELESGDCIPSCATWREYSHAEVILTDVLIILSAVIGLITGSAVIIMAIVRFKQM